MQSRLQARRLGETIVARGTEPSRNALEKAYQRYLESRRGDVQMAARFGCTGTLISWLPGCLLAMRL
jgi:hypothetical protein